MSVAISVLVSTLHSLIVLSYDPLARIVLICAECNGIYFIIIEVLYSLIFKELFSKLLFTKDSVALNNWITNGDKCLLIQKPKLVRSTITDPKEFRNCFIIYFLYANYISLLIRISNVLSNKRKTVFKDINIL